MSQCQITDTARSNTCLTAPTPEQYPVPVNQISCTLARHSTSKHLDQPEPSQRTTLVLQPSINLTCRDEQRWSSTLRSTNLQSCFLHPLPSNTSFLSPLSPFTITYIYDSFSRDLRRQITLLPPQHPNLGKNGAEKQLAAYFL